jgi:hypothetical protein
VSSSSWRRKDLLGLLTLLLTAASLLAQDSQSQPGAQSAPAENSEALRKAALNPIASLIGVPIHLDDAVANCILIPKGAKKKVSQEFLLEHHQTAAWCRIPLRRGISEERVSRSCR